MTTTPNTARKAIWTTARQGWRASIFVGLAVLLIRFKALIPLVWGLLEKNGSVHTLGKGLGDVVLIAGGVLFIYAVRTGYSRSAQALERNGNTAGNGPSDSSIVLRTIGRVSLLVNAPVLYWGLFLFVLLPLLVKIPNASLRIGTTAALAGAFLSMAVIVVLATHIGLLLIKFSFKSLAKVPELAAAPLSGDTTAASLPLPFAQQATYAQPGGYPVSPPMNPNNQPSPYGSPGNYYPAAPPQGNPALPSAGALPPLQPLSYPQQSGYPAGPGVAGPGYGPAPQPPQAPAPASSNGRPWGQ